MTTILDLPDEIHLLVGEQLSSKDLYSCIRVCRSFYTTYIPYLWSDIYVKEYKGKPIGVDQLRANSHRVETINYSSTLTDDYYTIVYPRLRTIRTNTHGLHKKDPNVLKVNPHQKAQFARLHPTIKKLYYDQPDSLSREFWEVVETEWKDFESLELSGIVVEDAVDIFWRICNRLKTLSFTNVGLLKDHSVDIFSRVYNLLKTPSFTNVEPPKDHSILSTLSFPHLRELTIARYSWSFNDIPHQTWPLHLLEQVKKAEGLRYLRWDVIDIPFPSRLLIDAFAEGCWSELCELCIGGPSCTDQDLASTLRLLPSLRLTRLDRSSDSLGPLTYSCLHELYFDHLQNLRVGQCTGFSSAMAQEVLSECVHLVVFDAPHIFVRDIATAPKSWGCSRLEYLTIYIAKQKDDEPGWDGQVFQQISRLGRLQRLDLQRSPHSYNGNLAPAAIRQLKTLDFRLSPLSNSVGTNENSKRDGNDGSSEDGIRCWSSLVQLQEFSFDGDQQVLGWEEARWMTEHWMDLWCISGEFRGVKGAGVAELEVFFKKKGVSYYE
ncbi:MAG: hypothetical protein JOS17DRAFT_779545 [Linnemannia elongata]|nr:MAG: hypothetical protein JOS17DRAFT_779545 [Linnemannia elongata]